MVTIQRKGAVMIKPRYIKMKSIFLFSLLILVQNLMADEAMSADSAASFIDYYSGRMIDGIGVRYDQDFVSLKDDKEGFEYTPRIYYQVNPKLALTFENQTKLNILEMEADVLENRYPSVSTTLFQAQYRPINNLQLFPFYEVYSYDTDYISSDELGNIDVHEGNRYWDGGIRGTLVTGKTELSLARSVLPWVYYSTDPLNFIPKNKWKLDFYTHFRKQTLSIESVHTRPDTFSNTLGQTGDIKQYQIEFNLIYGLKTHFMYLFHTRYDHTKTWDKYQLSTQPDTEEWNEVFEVGTGFDWIVYQNFMHQLLMTYQRRQLENANQDKQIDTGFNNRQLAPCWYLQYGGTWMSDIEPVNLTQLLDNKNQVFGKRIPKGVWKVDYDVTFDHKGLDEEFSLENDNQHVDVQKKETTLKNLEIILAPAVGLHHCYEAQFISHVRLLKRSAKTPSLTNSNQSIEPLLSSKKTEWWIGMQIQYGNYQYEDKWINTYGWHQLTPMDQLNGPILQQGMVTGTVKWMNLVQHHEDTDLFPYWDDQNYITENRRWIVDGTLLAGLWRGTMLQIECAYHAYYKALRNFRDEDWHVFVNMFWQPSQEIRVYSGFKTFRLETEPYRQLYNPKLSHKRTVRVWDLGVMAHF